MTSSKASAALKKGDRIRLEYTADAFAKLRPELVI
jgi:hypothetical protein